MRFQIGKVAKLLGMSSEGLRLYERAGILKPKRGEDDQSYRTYEHLDLGALVRIRGHHYSGFSTKEIASLIQAKEINTVRDLYAKREKKLEEELRWNAFLLEHLKEHQTLLAEAETCLNEVSLSVQPAIYRFPYMKDGEYLLGKKEEASLQQWIQKAPFVFFSQSNDWNQIISGTSSYSAGLGFLAHQKEFLNLDLTYADYHPERPALRAILRDDGTDFQPLLSMKPLMDYVAAHHLRVTGDPIARGILTMDWEDSFSRYREIWLPIEKI